jgi:hypothetical protein
MSGATKAKPLSRTLRVNGFGSPLNGGNLRTGLLSPPTWAKKLDFPQPTCVGLVNLAAPFEGVGDL